MDEITNAVMKTYDQMCENCDYVTISKAYSDLEVSTSKMFSKYENYILPHFLTFKCCSNKWKKVRFNVIFFPILSYCQRYAYTLSIYKRIFLIFFTKNISICCKVSSMIQESFCCAVLESHRCQPALTTSPRSEPSNVRWYLSYLL